MNKNLYEYINRIKELSGIKKPMLERCQLSEGGYSRLMQIMHGDVPKIKTVGILTAENPQGNPLPPEENNKRNKELETVLNSYNYSFSKIKGQFDYIKENPFFIFNIGREKLIELGKKYNQLSVIYGEKEGNNFEFQYIVKDKTISSKVFYHLDNPEDMYSEYKGRKFIIPFFDEKYKDAEWDGGKISFKENELPLNEEMKKKVDWIKECEKDLLEEGKIGKYYWENRGVIKVMTWEINDVLKVIR